MEAHLERLAADAEALDREAELADFLAAADDTDTERVQGEAEVLRAYAALNREVISAQVPVVEAETDDNMVVEVDGVTSDAAVTGDETAPPA